MGLSLQLGLDDFAKYPFLGEAGEFIRSLDLNLDELGGEDYSNVVRRARERILEAQHRGRVSEEYADSHLELLSFHIALMLVRATGLEHLASRFSHAESLRVEKLLEQERNKAVVAYIFRSLLKIDLAEVSERFGAQSFEYKIPLTEYLKRAVHFHKLEWKLVNRIVDAGYVYLKTPDLIRLIREEIKMIIYSRMKSVSTPKLPPLLEQAVQEIQKSVKPPRVYTEQLVSPSRYPPCVLHALDMSQKGQNIPHYGRFLMTTYLLGVGKTVDDIIALFPRVPDFNERVTRYQVEHIAGLRGGRTKYRSPSCRTLQTHSFCFKIPECDDIKNPIQFGRKKFGEKKEVKRRRRREQPPS